MEGKGKEALFLKVVLDLFDHEAVFGDLDGEVDLLNSILEFVDGQFVQFGDVDEIIAFLLVIVSFNGLSWLFFVQAPIPLTDVYV